MNERINELIDESKLTPVQEVFQEELYKFAELIVGECIDIVSPYAIRMENFDGGHPIADLKKHFGVK